MWYMCNTPHSIPIIINHVMKTRGKLVYHVFAVYVCNTSSNMLSHTILLFSRFFVTGNELFFLSIVVTSISFLLCSGDGIPIQTMMDISQYTPVYYKLDAINNYDINMFSQLVKECVHDYNILAKILLATRIFYKFLCLSINSYYF